MKYKHFISLGIVIAALVICASLPAFLARGHDLREVNTIHTVEMKPVQLGEDSTYTLPERLGLLSGQNTYEDSETMVFQTGVNYDHRSAQQNAQKQIDLLHAAGLLPEDSSAYTRIFVNGVEFIADQENPACNLMQWEIHALSDRYFVTLDMDDETGKILQYHVACTQTGDAWLEQIACKTAAQAWNDYLGLSLKAEEDTRKQARMTLLLPGSPGAQIPDLDDNSQSLRIVLGDDKADVTYFLYVTPLEFWNFVV
ncbi:MAG: hypothetical protein Q3Y08_09925 [Butyricicoccus sp.]|nr:hypothetical protein [Butyricicoccus sp.]